MLDLLRIIFASKFHYVFLLTAEYAVRVEGEDGLCCVWGQMKCFASNLGYTVNSSDRRSLYSFVNFLLKDLFFVTFLFVLLIIERNLHLGKLS